MNDVSIMMYLLIKHSTWHLFEHDIIMQEYFQKYWPQPLTWNHPKAVHVDKLLPWSIFIFEKLRNFLGYSIWGTDFAEIFNISTKIEDKENYFALKLLIMLL